MAQTTPREFKTIGDYAIEEEIGRGAMSVVYRGRIDTRTFAIKVASAASLERSEQALLRFRKEVAAAARLNDSGLVKVVEVGEVSSRPYVVMDLAEGQSLDKILAAGALSPERTVSIAKAVAHALIEVHRFGLVHRDIKPGNIMVSEDGKTKLIDFGFVTGAMDEQASDKDAVVGTLYYAAPEQIGVLKRAIDARADLYALGVTLFECLTTTLPFQATTLADLLSKLATQRAPDVRERRADLGVVLSSIVGKLLAKDPDDRYQSARGLLADLEMLGELESQQRRGEPVVLGAREMGIKNELPMVGRAAEFSQIGALWKAVKQGRGALAQIEGESGSGKTRLVRELILSARAEGALVLMGKCQELETVPFGPLREAVEDYAAHIARLGAAERGAATEQLKKAAGEGAPVLKRLSRTLGTLLGEVAEPPQLEPEGERQRFYTAIVEFLGELSRLNRSAILVIDDIQWLDESSREVLQKLASRVSTLPLLVVSTARSDAQSAAARAMYAQAMGEHLKKPIALQPLDRTAIGELVAANLGGKPLAGPVVERLAMLTRGNPFAIGEYVRALLDHGHLRPFAGGWSVMPEALSDVSLPRDIIQLVVNRLTLLSEDTSRVIGLAGALGGEFTPALLASAARLSPEQIARCLEESVRANLLEQRENGAYMFVHDRVREAAIERLSKEQLRDTHQALAEALDKIPEASTLFVYALAHQYAHGHAEKNAKRVCETNMVAGLQAVNTSAFERGYELLTRALDFAKRAEIYKQHGMQIEEALGRACTMTGRNEEAHGHLSAALGFAEQKADRFRLQFLVTLANASQGDVGLDGLYKAFDILGRPYPRSLLGQVATMQGYWMAGLLLKWTGIGRGSAKGEDREIRKSLSQLHSLGVLLALFNGDAVLQMQFILRDFFNVHFLGVTEEAAVAYSLYGATMHLMALRGTADRHMNLGLEIADQLGSPVTRAMCLGNMVFGHAWSGATDKAVSTGIDAATKLQRMLPGSANFAIALTATSYDTMFLGWSRMGIDRLTSFRPGLRQTNHLLWQHNTLVVLWVHLMLSGRTAEAMEVRKACNDFYKGVRKPPKYLQLGDTMTRLHVGMDQGESDAELEKYIQEYYSLKIPLDYYATNVHCDIAYQRFAQFAREKDPAARAKARSVFKSAMMGFTARGSLLPVYRAHIFALRAALAREDGQFEKAHKLLARGAANVSKIKNAWGGYQIALGRARLAHAEGDAGGSRAHAIVALEIAREQSWENRAKRVAEEFSLEPQAMRVGSVSDISMLGSVVRGTTQSFTTSRVDSQRYADALLQVSLASASTLNMDEQAQASLAELAKVLGAEHALLFLNKEGQSHLELAATFGIDAADQKDFAEYSSTVVQKVRDTRQPIVLAGTEEGQALGSQSAVAYGLRSIIAAPLLMRDTMVGIVYLDNRLAKGVFTEADLSILLGIGNHIAIAVETTRMAQVEAAKKGYEKDMALTAAVQTLFLPKDKSFTQGNLSLSGMCRTASQCGGDWWWYGMTPQGNLRVMIADVTGHGAAPAMVTASFAGAHNALWRQDPATPMVEVLKQLHGEVRALTQGQYMVAVSAIEIDPKTRRMDVWSAGAPAVALLKKSGEVRLVTLTGAPLGSPEDFACGHEQTSIAADERVMMFSDGLPELDLPSGSQLGMRALMKMVRATSSKSCVEACEQLSQDLDKARRDVIPADDMTCALIDLA